MYEEEEKEEERARKLAVVLLFQKRRGKHLFALFLLVWLPCYVVEENISSRFFCLFERHTKNLLTTIGSLSTVGLYWSAPDFFINKENVNFMHGHLVRAPWWWWCRPVKVQRLPHEIRVLGRTSSS